MRWVSGDEHTVWCFPIAAATMCFHEWPDFRSLSCLFFRITKHTHKSGFHTSASQSPISVPDTRIPLSPIKQCHLIHKLTAFRQSTDLASNIPKSLSLSFTHTRTHTLLPVSAMPKGSSSSADCNTIRPSASSRCQLRVSVVPKITLPGKARVCQPCPQRRGQPGRLSYRDKRYLPTRHNMTDKTGMVVSDEGGVYRWRLDSANED